MCFEAKLTSAINLIYFGAKTKPGSEWSFRKKFSESGGRYYSAIPPSTIGKLFRQNSKIYVQNSLWIFPNQTSTFLIRNDSKKKTWMEKKKSHKRKRGDIFIVKGADNRINSYCRVLGNSLKIRSCNFLFRKLWD